MAHNTGSGTIVRELGRVRYEETYRAMRELSAARVASSPDEIWLLEHEPVYTLGTHADAGHVLAPGDTPVISTDRGGQVTWHGTGQLVVYVMLDLARAKLGVRDLVCRLERAVIDTLAGYGISAAGRDGAPGVYCGAAKIASVGLRIRKHASYHGIAVNVSNDLAPFGGINPCGYEGLSVTRICDEGGPASVAAVAADLLPNLLRSLNMKAADCRSD
jgi:lipoyl(octanoyl) transferase